MSAHDIDLAAGIAPYFAGPAAAVLCLLLVLFGLWRASVTYLVPMAQAAINRHLGQIDQMIAIQREEGKRIGDALQAQLALLTHIDKKLEAK